MTSERRQVLDIFEELSEIEPQMRMGQWLALFASLALGPKAESIYDVEDEELMPVMQKFLSKRLTLSQTAAGGVE